MGFIGRGWDWIPTVGNYSRLARSGAKALTEVLNMGPKYREHLREGSALRAGDDATRNFHQAMLDMAANGVRRMPEKFAHALGLNPLEAAKAIYNVSHKILWNVNDMILFQRQLELEMKGMAKRDAIKESERWIANYRVPPQVFKSRAFKQFITNGDWINFGRYTYGKWRAIGEMIKSLVKGSPSEKLDATGKVVAAGVMALFIYPVMNLALKKITGNQNARFPMGGELSPVDAARDFSTGEKDWASSLSSFLTPAPLIEHGTEVMKNQDFFGQPIVDPDASPLGKGVEAGEYAASLFYPAQIGIQALRPGGAEGSAARVIGASMPKNAPGTRPPYIDRMQRRRAAKREKNDQVEQFIKSLAGQ